MINRLNAFVLLVTLLACMHCSALPRPQRQDLKDKEAGRNQVTPSIAKLIPKGQTEAEKMAERLLFLRAQVEKELRKENYGSAMAMFAEILELGNATIINARTWADDDHLRAVLSNLRQDAEAIYTLTALHPNNPDLALMAWRYAAVNKGRLLREQFASTHGLGYWTSQEHPEVWKKLDNARKTYAEYLLRSSKKGFAVKEERTTQGSVAHAWSDLQSVLGEIRSIDKRSVDFNEVGRDLELRSEIGSGSLGLMGNVFVCYLKYADRDFNNVRTKSGERYLALIKRGEATYAVPLGNAENIDHISRLFRNEISNPRGNYKIPAQQLFRLIIKPLEQYFQTPGLSLENIRLTILPEDVLFEIPFEALLDENVFLLDKYRILYATDVVGINIWMTRRNSNPSKSIAIFYNPKIAPSWEKDFLVNADEEAEKIGNLWPEKGRQMLTRKMATGDSFIASAPTKGFIHFAGHAILANREGQVAGRIDLSEDSTGNNSVSSSWARSALLLAPSPESERKTGAVSALEITGLDLTRTQIAVLAACDTGLGDRERGEGIYALPRAFVLAGAESAVGSLWEVDSEATSRLMVTFYRKLFQGASRAEALRMAESFVRLKFPHPYYWASFFILGNTNDRVKLPEESED